MTWQTGTSTDHIDLLNQLREIATSDHVSAVVVNAGGTGYVVGDILTVAGGTSTHTATIEVLTVSTGAVATVRIKTGGAYTADPTLTANAVTGGTGSSCTLDLTMTATGWTVVRESEEVTAAAINSGGTGYTVNDVLTVVGGLGDGVTDAVVAATITVDTVSSGVITAVTVTTGGHYEEPISPTTAVTVTGGTGTGATFDLTFAVLTDAEKILVMEGTAGGAGDDVTVAIKTFNTASGFNTAYNWMLLGLQDFSAALTLQDQSNVSPGLATSGSGPVVVTEDTTQGAYVPLKDDDGFPMDFWFSITDRRIVGVVKLETAIITHYASFYLGFLNQFGTAAERPYPIYVSGCQSRYNAFFADAAPKLMSGITELYGGSSEDGPGWYRRHSSSAWVEVRNGGHTESSGTRAISTGDGHLYPTGKPDVQPTGADRIVADNADFDWQEMIQMGSAVSPVLELRETPGSPDDVRPLIPCAVLYTDGTAPGDFEIQGELDNVFWTSIAGGSPSVGSEDSFAFDGDVYSIFQNGNRANVYSFMVIKED